MKFYTTLLLAPFVTVASYAQELNRDNQNYADSLRIKLNTATHDSVRLVSITNLARYFENLNVDSTFFYASKGLLIARKNKQQLYEAVFLLFQIHTLRQKGQYAATLKNLLQSFEILQNPASEKNAYTTDNLLPHLYRLKGLALAHGGYAGLMAETGNKEQAVFHSKEGLRFATQFGDKFRIGSALNVIANQYLALDITDSAEVYALNALRIYLEINLKKYLSGPLRTLASVYTQKKNDELAKNYLNQALQAAASQEDINKRGLIEVYIQLSRFYQTLEYKDSSLFYSKKVYALVTEPEFENTRFLKDGEVYQDLYQSYLLNNKTDSAFKYQGLALATKNEWNKEKLKNLADFQSLLLTEANQLRDLEKKQLQTQSNIRTGAFLVGLAVFSIIAFFLYRNNLQKQKANAVLQKQKDKVESTLHELKSTQSQLIQSEKMASLGELTAGIAHEIQNPLNFVNNFSEVNKELLVELKDEIMKGNLDEVNALADDVIANEEKINRHGKRADTIVKGMLQHSSSGSGKKEPTDINALADEYLRLAYHGLRAKDNSFNATLKTDFDESIGNINIIPQDIGRVILNLINNAFYVVDEKKKQQPAGYEPTVSVSTKKINGKVEIKVADNGNGIPQKVLDKIFQPFFTTKPTGQGTGLGLSLSYDIVKAHGGELTVETKEGKETEFIIKLLNR